MVVRPWVWAAGLGAVLALLFCAGTGASTPRTSRLEGFVLSAPSTPVCMPRVPCLRRAAGVVLGFERRGAVRGRVVTAKDGSYEVMLAPGSYAVRVLRPLGVRRPTPAAVSLAAGQTKRVTFYLDTGIR
jgi:hypothetical protein